MNNLSIVVAADENNVIGRDNRLIWHLPADLQYFKKVTLGHHIIMGRKTFESIGKPLPGRTSVIVTRQKDFRAEGCIVVNSIEEALQKVPAGQEVNIIGGAQLFEQTLPLADKVFFTRVHHTFEGDTYFPELDPAEWRTVSKEDHQPDEKNQYPYSFIVLERK